LMPSVDALELDDAADAVDPCVVITEASIDPDFAIPASASIDPGIFAEPSVRGLPYRAAAAWRDR
jgi:hypothetical protein